MKIVEIFKVKNNVLVCFEHGIDSCHIELLSDYSGYNIKYGLSNISTGIAMLNSLIQNKDEILKKTGFDVTKII